MKHCRPDYKPWEQNMTCCNCAHPLDDNPRMRETLRVNTTAGWAKRNLHILAEMAADNGLPDWYVEEILRIQNGINVMSPNAGNQRAP